MSAEQDSRVRRGRRAVAGAVVLLGLLSALSPADDQDPGAGHAGALVMKNGKLVLGRIQQNAGGYVLERPNGSLFIPAENVQLVARDKHDAYQQLRAASPTPTAAHFVALARWCLTYELYDEARNELREALTLEPMHREARGMLVRLQELLDPAAIVPASASEPEHDSPHDAEPPPARSLSGLSRDTAETFVTRVQPLLVNKCGNAGCHGQAASNGFRLTHVRLGEGSHRIYAERNLAVVLQQVDLAQPDRSALLTVARGNHGRGGRAIFHGPAGNEQLALLQHWIRDAAREAAATARQPRGPSVTDRPISTDTDQILLSGRSSASGPHSGKVENVSHEADVLETILQEERTDQFDPRKFNRLVHGQR